MTYLSMLFYVLSLMLFSASMSNPARPQIGIFAIMLLVSAVLFGMMLHRRIYGRHR